MRQDPCTQPVHWDGELWGTVSTPYQAQTLPPTRLPHLGGRQHLTARFSMGLFLRVPGMAPGSKPDCGRDRWPR